MKREWHYSQADFFELVSIVRSLEEAMQKQEELNRVLKRRVSELEKIAIKEELEQ